MPTCLYVVIKSRGSWWVDCEGKTLGPVDTKQEAADYAVKVAELFGDPARRWRVMIPDEAGRYILYWEKGVTADKQA
jgi:hypothetical protein